MAARLGAAVVAAALLACGSKGEAPAKGAAGSANPAPGSAQAAPGSAQAATGTTGATAIAPAVRPPAPARDKGPIPAAYRDALRRGRQLTAAKQYAEAGAAFRAALAAVPDDARALSELSWTLYLAKDPAAKDVALQAVAAGRNNVKAASLYNLGRILEDAGAGGEAANAYRASLAMRPNKTVADRLAALDPAAAPLATTLEIEEWGPPAPTRPATCAALGDDDEGFAAWSPDGACDVVAADVAVTGAGPFTAVTQLTRKRGGSDEAFVAVQTADGWLLSPPFLSWGGVGTWGATATVVAAEVVAHPTLGPVLRLDVKTGESGRWESWDTEATSLCQPSRAGGSGALTCTPWLATSWLHRQDDDDAVDESCAAAIALAADGAVTLTSKSGKPPTDCPIHLGRFAWPRAR